jgi:hypothetical protein
VVLLLEWVLLILVVAARLVVGRGSAKRSVVVHFIWVLWTVAGALQLLLVLVMLLVLISRLVSGSLVLSLDLLSVLVVVLLICPLALLLGLIVSVVFVKSFA